MPTWLFLKITVRKVWVLLQLSDSIYLKYNCGPIHCTGASFQVWKQQTIQNLYGLGLAQSFYTKDSTGNAKSSQLASFQREPLCVPSQPPHNLCHPPPVSYHLDPGLWPAEWSPPEGTRDYGSFGRPSMASRPSSLLKGMCLLLCSVVSVLWCSNTESLQSDSTSDMILMLIQLYNPPWGTVSIARLSACLSVCLSVSPWNRRGRMCVARWAGSYDMLWRWQRYRCSLEVKNCRKNGFWKVVLPRVKEPGKLEQK